MIKLKFETLAEFIEFCHNTEYSPKGRHSESLEAMIIHLEESLTNEQFFFACRTLQRYRAIENKPHRVTDN